MSNLSILELNILHGFSDCDISSRAFLRALSCSSLAKAERFANETHLLVSCLNPLLQEAASNFGLDAVPDGLLGFILDRHWHANFGQQARGLA